MHRIALLACVLALGLADVLIPRAAPAAGDINCGAYERRLLALEFRRSRRPRCFDLANCPSLARRLAFVKEQLADHCVALNHIQVLGSHNSFHVRPLEPLWSALLDISSVIFGAWEYTHLPLDQQFETQGVRQIELDVFADPDGGLFASRDALRVIGLDPASGLPELDQPGFKVLHIQDVDFETTCLSFVSCLTAIRTWSDLNPGHLPIMVLVEAKDDALPDTLGVHFATPVPIGTAEFDALDAEIRSVFPPEKLLTPDDVREGHATLEEAVLELGWPTLSAVRGKIIFLLDNGGAKHEAYRAGRPSLEGRVLFTNSNPGEADAAFVKENNPFAARIPDLVAGGYLVRTRADVDTVEARSGNTVPRDTALASGAHCVSTDFPVANHDFGTGYEVRIPGGEIARCNPVNAPVGCRAEALERLP
jgi:hypothetical protein